jgi:hypothetical protein
MSGEQMVKREAKTRADFDDQQTKGWTDFHPEDYCHRCGHPNPTWWVDGDVWDYVMRDTDGNQRWDGIVCPTCFDEVAVVYRAAGLLLWEFRVDPKGRGSRVLLRSAGAA